MYHPTVGNTVECHDPSNEATQTNTPQREQSQTALEFGNYPYLSHETTPCLELGHRSTPKHHKTRFGRKSIKQQNEASRHNKNAAPRTNTDDAERKRTMSTNQEKTFECKKDLLMTIACIPTIESESEKENVVAHFRAINEVPEPSRKDTIIWFIRTVLETKGRWELLTVWVSFALKYRADACNYSLEAHDELLFKVMSNIDEKLQIRFGGFHLYLAVLQTMHDASIEHEGYRAWAGAAFRALLSMYNILDGDATRVAVCDPRIGSQELINHFLHDNSIHAFLYATLDHELSRFTKLTEEAIVGVQVMTRILRIHMTKKQFQRLLQVCKNNDALYSALLVHKPADESQVGFINEFVRARDGFIAKHKVKFNN